MHCTLHRYLEPDDLFKSLADLFVNLLELVKVPVGLSNGQSGLKHLVDSLVHAPLAAKVSSLVDELHQAALGEVLASAYA